MKRRSRTWLAAYYDASDAEVKRLEQQDPSHAVRLAFAEAFHDFTNRYVSEHPHQVNDYVATYPLVESYKKSRRTGVEKAAKTGFQGVIGFYEKDDHLPIDQDGTVVRFEVATLEQFDSWWELEVKTKEAQDAAHAAKNALRLQIRQHMTPASGPRPTVGIVMEEVFHWSRLRGMEIDDE